MARNQKKKAITKVDSNSSTAHSLPSKTRASIGQVKDDKMSSQTSSSKESTGHDSRPAKRLKTNADSAISHNPLTEPSATQNPACPIEVTLTDSPSSVLSIPTELQHIQGQYDISTISIISSSKIHQKVTNLITRLENFTFANTDAKPGVVVLRAKATSASKLISVVEIAKADIAKRGGKWYEYSKLHSELLQFNKKKRSQPQDGRTLADVASERFTRESGTVENDAVDTEGDDSDDGEVAFETLQHQSGGTALKEQSKVRATPIMTTYLACVPVPGLKDLLGWVADNHKAKI
ncbi:MAG: hypothetical protein Q9178_006066 [Gyalolechia marmorata]